MHTTLKIVLTTVISLTTLHIGHAALIQSETDTNIAGPTVDGSIGAGEYFVTYSGGGGGFGGPVGGATLHVDSDLTNLCFGFEGLGDMSGNSMVIYLDTDSSGGLADNSGINDNSNFGTGRISNAANPLTYPFDADFGLVVTPAFGGFTDLYALANGGDGALGPNLAHTDSGVGEPNNSTVEICLPYSSLGISAGDTVDFAVTYGNNNSPAFMSDEGFPNPPSPNPGDGAVTFSDFHRIMTVPEPIGLMMFFWWLIPAAAVRMSS